MRPVIHQTAVLVLGSLLLLGVGCAHSPAETKAQLTETVLASERPRVIRKADAYLFAEPITVTAEQSERSAGGAHDFYSEGDYWWPNPEDPDGPYIRKDGLTNPDNFIAHRQALMRLNDIVASLASAYRVTGNEDYARAAATHLHAWFVAPETRMAPHLRYGQAIKGRSTGRSIGIIDTIHLVEVARSAQYLVEQDQLTEAERAGVTGWFRRYLNWLNEHPFGLKERNHPNNHGVGWAMQAAAFADLLGDEDQLAQIRSDFKTRFVQGMMAQDGSFPAELERTKAYGYSLFMLDCMAAVAQIASTPEDNLWHYRTEDGRGMARAMAYMKPYIRDKDAWPLAPDLLYWEEWPVRHPSLVFAAWAFDEPDYLSLWQPLEADPDEYEVRRNLPLRHPLLWLPE